MFLAHALERTARYPDIRLRPSQFRGDARRDIPDGNEPLARLGDGDERADGLRRQRPQVVLMADVRTRRYCISSRSRGASFSFSPPVAVQTTASSTRIPNLPGM